MPVMIWGLKFNIEKADATEEEEQQHQGGAAASKEEQKH